LSAVNAARTAWSAGALAAGLAFAAAAAGALAAGGAGWAQAVRLSAPNTAAMANRSMERSAAEEDPGF